VLFKGTKEAIQTDGFLGLFRGGLTSSSAGISAALIFSYLASLIFDPKTDI
jgi:stage V sporulation protein AE